MRIIEVKAKSVNEATKIALNRLGLKKKNDISVDVVNKAKNRLFGFGSNELAEIKVSYDESLVDATEKTMEILVNIFNKMGLPDVIESIVEKENKIYVELKSDEHSGLIIGKKGKTLESLQFMTNLVVNHQIGSNKKIIIDIEAYRGKREKALRKLSKDVAQKVVKNQKPWSMEPMNPFERRLVHMTLQNDSRVSTKSEGQGIYRKVTVIPKAKPSND